MKTKNILSTICLSASLIMATASCDDFLELAPPNSIVLENYWDSEEDVQQVVASCYSAMATQDFVKRALFWGEVRSENFIDGNGLSTEDEEILEGNLMPKHSITDWSSYYNVINLCNTVMHYGPGVIGKDPDFLQSEMEAYDAEVRTLRALCYFYLVRTFKKVPLVLEPTISNDKEYYLPAAGSDTILEQITADLLHAEKYAKKEYSKEVYNVGRITVDAIHAILADVYLWRQDYENCVKYSSLVIESKKETARKQNTAGGTSGGSDDEVSASAEYPLIGYDMKNNTDPYVSYYEIFGKGNSSESIFELQFTEDVQTNSTISNYYGDMLVQTGAFTASKVIGEEATTVGNKVFKKTDIRAVEFFRENSNVYQITKYAAINIGKTKVPVYRNTDYANWIFYRLTDIMLLKAEALTQLAKRSSGENDNDSTQTTLDDQTQLQEAFKLTSAVYYRSQTGLTKSDSLQFTDYSSSSKMYEFVLLERHRELIFEGKRWFDLMRLALREGNNTNMLNYCTRKYSDNIKTVKSKISTENSLYFPYNTNELEVNILLTQNPAYVNEASTVTSK